MLGLNVGYCCSINRFLIPRSSMAKKQFNSVRYMTWKRLLIVVATAVVLENQNLPSVNATTGAFTSSWLSARCTNRICSRIGRKSAPFGNVSGTVKESLYGKDESEPMLSVAAETSDWDHRTSTNEPVSSGFLSNNSRRDFFIQAQQQASSVFLSSLILGPMAAYAQDPLMTGADTKKKTIVITGANSGIGLEACKRLAKQGHTLILACRSLDKAKEAVECIRQQETTVMGSLIPAECDLASMASIKSFAEGLPAKIRQTNQDTTTAVTIDTLCLNAGIARNTAATDCARSVDGFELTVATNHFGHFFLNQLLLPMLAVDGRIVVTASSVHDPESPGGAQGVPATLGNLEGLQRQGKDCEMLDGTRFNADKAYKDSKLCNVLFTRELQRRLEMNDATKGISVNCFSPGLIVGTGLFRDQNPFFIKLFDIAATDLFKVGETPEWGGQSLVYMTTMSSKGLFYNSQPGSSKYGDAAFGREFVPTEVSTEGQDDEKAKLLWDLSSYVLGIAA